MTRTRLEEQLLALLHRFVDHEDAPCRYDHHGTCQEHPAANSDGCAVADARKLFAEMKPVVRVVAGDPADASGRCQSIFVVEGWDEGYQMATATRVQCTKRAGHEKEDEGHADGEYQWKTVSLERWLGGRLRGEGR